MYLTSMVSRMLTHDGAIGSTLLLWRAAFLVTCSYC